MLRREARAHGADAARSNHGDAELFAFHGSCHGQSLPVA
jgi:hypothetical protein